MLNHQGGRPDNRGAGYLRWVERLLVIAGATMLVWCALVVVDATMSQQLARQSLEIASRSVLSSHPREPDGTSGVLPHTPTVDTGSAIAALSIPRVDLSAVVLHGSDARTLRRGPGHLENTALPGESGNVVIAGHRDTFFRPLRNVQPGDDIFMDTPQGRVQYRVTSLRVVDAHDVSVLEPTDEAVLTLITCYPFWVLGNAPDRFVVRATRVADPAAVTVPARTTPPRVPIDAPSVQEPTAGESVLVNSRVAPDDETLVREAIERFRLTYNARLINHNDVRPDGALKFQACDIIVSGDQATAHCGTSSESIEDSEPHVWTSTLKRAEREWAITSIVAN